MEDCLFCGIAGKSVPAELIHEDDRSVAFPDANPQAPVHFLVIPKTHVADVREERDPAVLGHLLSAASRLGSERSPEGFRIVINSGNQAEIPHLHLHVIGGKPALGALTS